jgi:hypothetical protein
MIRRTDLIGLVGFAMTILGTQLMFSTSGDGMHWDYRIGGLALWFTGFNAVVGWLILRWSQAGKSRPK